MCEAIQKRRSHLCISEDLGPFREAEVGCYDDAGRCCQTNANQSLQGQ